MGRRLFSERSFASVIRAGDSHQFDVDLLNDRDTILKQASHNARNSLIDLGKYHASSINGKPCVSYRDYEACLLLREISRRLRHRLRVRVAGREQIVRGAIESLLDATPMHIIRRDISSFYESVPISEIRDELIYDTASSSLMRSYLKKFFDEHCPSKGSGVPRGIGLSALVSELVMRKFGQRIRSLTGVFKYYRFSDDIIVFTTDHPNNVAKELSNLPGDMKLNQDKCFEVFLSDDKAATPSCFEYLGYKFKATSTSKKEFSRSVSVAISNRKVKKLKSRIILSFKCFRSDGNFHLLRDRLKYLATNMKIRRQGNTDVKHTPFIHSGIFYNYNLCGHYRVRRAGLEQEKYDCSELKEIDGFYHSLVKKQANASVKKLHPAAVAELRRYSFYKGYDLRLRSRFSSTRVAEIKEVWRSA